MRLDTASVGVLFSMYMIGTISGSVLGPWLVRRMGTPIAIRVALVVLGASAVAFALSPSFLPAASLRLVGGFAGGVAWIGCLSWMISRAPSGQRGAVLGSVMSASVVGTLVGPLLGNLALVVGTVAAFSLVAGMCAVIVIALPKNKRSGPEPAIVSKAAVSARVRRWITAGSAATLAIVAACYGALLVLLPLMLSGAGIDDLAIGWVFVGAAAGSAIVNSQSGKASDLVGSGPLIAVSLGGTAVTIGALSITTAAPVLIVLVLVLMGAVLPLAVTPASAAVSLDAEAMGAGTVASTLIMVAFGSGEVFGGIVGPAVAGATTESTALACIVAVVVASLAIVATTARARCAVNAA